MGHRCTYLVGGRSLFSSGECVLCGSFLSRCPGQGMAGTLSAEVPGRDRTPQSQVISWEGESQVILPHPTLHTPSQLWSDICFIFPLCKASPAAGSEPDKQMREGVGRLRTPSLVHGVVKRQASSQECPLWLPRCRWQVEVGRTLKVKICNLAFPILVFKP